MFNKKKCKICAYSGRLSGGSYPSCDYCIRTGHTCTKKDGTDIRGNNPNKCKLFKEEENAN